jgi:hypothetical protein
MANLAINSANVVNSGSITTKQVTAGAAISAGQVVYLNGDGLYYPANAAGNAIQAGANGIGVALSATNGASQPLVIMTGGAYNTGNAALTNGGIYCVSATNGLICPFADLSSGQFVTTLFIATTPYIGSMFGNAGPYVSGIAHG